MAYIDTPGDTRVADNSDALVEEPSSTVHTNGWNPDEQPPAQWFNALFKRLYRWTMIFFAHALGAIQWSNAPYCAAPKVAANLGGSTGHWSLFIPAIRSVSLASITFKSLSGVALNCTHVAGADKMVNGSDAALYADSVYFVYITATGATPTYVINRTAPVTETPFDASGRRYLCHFRTDNQGTFSGAYASDVGVPIPFAKNGKRIAYYYDRDTEAFLLAGTIVATGASFTTLDLGDWTGGAGCTRATLYANVATNSGLGTTILEASNRTGGTFGKQFELEASYGAEFSHMTAYTASIPDVKFYGRVNGGGINIYVTDYDDPWDC